MSKKTVSMELFCILVMVLGMWLDVFVKTHRNSTWKRVSFIDVSYTSVHLTIKKTKQEQQSEDRNPDWHNEILNIVFILGASAELGRHDFWGHRDIEG